MTPRSVLSAATALGLLALASTGHAQQPGPATQTPEVMPPPGAEPSAEAPAKKAPSQPIGGYAYTDRPAASHPRYRSKGPVVNMPGFEQTGDGGSRLFVQLSQSVPVEERKGHGVITYVLKGASPRVWNNTNALVTVHFNTPVSRARLVPHGADLHFIVELRAAATPTWKMNESQDKSATLAIEFPKGEFLSSGGPSGEAPAASAPAGRPAPKGRGGKHPKPAPAPAKSEEPAEGAKP